ncbi:hypothetical protein F7725_011032, partial [Dissostichus mawsoni]
MVSQPTMNSVEKQSNDTPLQIIASLADSLAPSFSFLMMYPPRTIPTPALGTIITPEGGGGGGKRKGGRDERGDDGALSAVYERLTKRKVTLLRILTAALGRSAEGGEEKGLHSGFDEGEEVKSISAAGVSSLTLLYSDQEETDTRMVLHAIHLAESYSRIIVRSDDTGVEVLLIYYASKYMFGSSLVRCHHPTRKTGSRGDKASDGIEGLGFPRRPSGILGNPLSNRGGNA